MASNSILKLQVDDRQYEASLKSAQQGLQALMNALHNSGKSFSDLDKNTEQYVRALGNMEATAKTTRGRIGEMSSAFIELSQVEKQLTDQERQSPVGKALTESLDQLKQRTIEAKKELADLDKQLTSQKAPETTDGSLLSKLGGKMDGALAVFGGNLMTKAAGMGVGLVTEMTDAVKQGIELAKAGEGVRIAFERLGRGDILQGLREATHGTVTDLELMKAAVKFNDFKLPVEELGTMLAFAQQKAKDTGQSVDYMVDSIVTGLGRKSLMILDNLGLSASEIRERMKETGDMTKAVGAIIREQMASAGEYVETAADRAAQANVSLQNKMEELGRKVAPLEESFNNLWTSMKVGILDVIGGPLTDLLNKLTQAGRMANQYSLMGGNTKVGQMTSNLAGVSEDKRLSIYQLQKAQFRKYINPREQQLQDIRAWQSGERTESLRKRINVITEKYGSLDTTKIQAEVDAAKKMLADYEQAAKPLLNPVNVNVNTQQAEQNVASLRRQLKELEVQRKKAVKAGDQEQVENLTKQISQVKTNLGYLDPKATKTGSSSKTVHTEIQENQTKINTLTQEYVKLGDESTEAARKRQAEIQKEIELLQQRNGLLGKRTEQAQGRLLSNDDIKRKAEIDMQVNTKQIEDLRRQLTGIEGVTIEPKSVTITATDEALPKLREIEGITIDDKTMTVTAETTDALRALQGIEGVTIDPKTIEVNANTSEAQQKIDELKAKIAELEDKNINIKAFVDNVGKPLGEQQLNNNPGTLLKEPDTAIPSGGLQLDEKAMKAVQKNIDNQKKDVGKIGDEWSGVASAIGAVGNAMEGIEDPAAKVLGIVAQAIATVALTFSKSLAGTVSPWDWIAAAAAGTATMISTISAIHSATGFANGGVIDSGHSPAFLSFSKAAPAFATGGIIQKFNEGGTVEAGHAPDFLSFSKAMPKFATGGIIQKFNEGGTVEAGHAPDFLSFSKAMQKFATGGIIPKFNEGGTVEAGHAPDFISFSKAMPKRFAYGGTVPHAANGYFIGGSHFSGDVTPIMANAGELVLNKAQQGNLASQLQGGGIQNLNLTATIKGEQIRLALNNNGRRTGRGEYVQSRNVR